jgi:nitric oxide reductase subunit B
MLEWLRLPGDVLFIAGGAIPTLYIAYLGIRHTVTRVTLEEPDDILFTEVVQTDAMAQVDRAQASSARLT